MDSLKLLLLVAALFVGVENSHNSLQQTVQIAEPQIVRENSRVVLECNLQSSDKMIQDQIYWNFSTNTSTRDEAVLSRRWRFSNSNTSITIESVSWKEAGVYKCYTKQSNEFCGVTHLSVLVFDSDSVYDGTRRTATYKPKDFIIEIYDGNFDDISAKVFKVLTAPLDGNFNTNYQLQPILKEVRRKTRDVFKVPASDIAESNSLIIEMSYKNVTSNYNLPFKLAAVPEIYMDNVTTHWNDFPVKFTCNVRAHLSSNITMTFLPCSESTLDALQWKDTDASALHVTRRNDLTSIFASALIERPRFGVVKCTASNRYGNTSVNAVLLKNLEHTVFKRLNRFAITESVLGGLALLSVVCLVMYFIRHKPIANPEEKREKESIIPGALEISKSNLMLGRKLGEGEFGVVLMALAEGISDDEPPTTVAVKIIRNNNNESMAKAMISELKMIILVGQHLNIVNLIGAVTENIENNELMIVLEYCRYGSVLEFIRKNKHRFMNTLDSEMEPRRVEDPEESNGGLRNTFQTTDLICWAKQVADGMDYLASKNVFHGDLAARNVLLCEDNVVKISDFGLTRSFNYKNMYKKKSKDRVPYKWLALESMSGQIFSVASDVWAYGVFLWELFSLGTVPYPGIPLDEHFYDLLRGGYRMEQPRYASRTIYDVMLLCWNENPNLRPTFDKLARVCNAMLPKELQDHYMALGDPFMQANKARKSSHV